MRHVNKPSQAHVSNTDEAPKDIVYTLKQKITLLEETIQELKKRLQTTKSPLV